MGIEYTATSTGSSTSLAKRFRPSRKPTDRPMTIANSRAPANAREVSPR